MNSHVDAIDYTSRLLMAPPPSEAPSSPPLMAMIRSILATALLSRRREARAAQDAKPAPAEVLRRTMHRRSPNHRRMVSAWA